MVRLKGKNMQDTRPKGLEANIEQGMKDRHADATSKETLDDLRESEKISQSNNSQEKQSIPSPDGQVDGKAGERADGSDTDGPV
jgi:hypothetical protein